MYDLTYSLYIQVIANSPESKNYYSMFVICYYTLLGSLGSAVKLVLFPSPSSRND